MRGGSGSISEKYIQQRAQSLPFLIREVHHLGTDNRRDRIVQHHLYFNGSEKYIRLVPKLSIQ